jgi:hypothetical protein
MCVTATATGSPSFEGSYRYLFPAILGAKIHTVSMEFARRAEDDLQLFKEFNVPFSVGIGVIRREDQRAGVRHRSWPTVSGGRWR